jgi:hypothetical protein
MACSCGKEVFGGVPSTNGSQINEGTSIRVFVVLFADGFRFIMCGFTVFDKIIVGGTEASS